MYNFEKLLYPGEKILYKGKPVPGKGHKGIGALTISIIAFAFFIFLLIAQLKEHWYDLNSIIILLVLLFFEGIFIYGLIYNLFIKKRIVADDEYCITNQRAFKYESKTGNLVFGYLKNYRSVRAMNVKDNYGDVRMEILYKDGKTLEKEDLKVLKNLMLHPNEEDMPYILFESIENPEAIVKLIFEARSELRKNSSN